jgi:hypothetical protein
MDSRLPQLADRYRAARPPDERIDAAIDALHTRTARDREHALLDPAATCAGLAGIVLNGRFEFAQLDPPIQEAFYLACSERGLDALATAASEAARQGLLSLWKGKYFEVLVRDRLNEGEWVGDLHLEPGQTAILADSPTQPGWDLQIVDPDGAVDAVYQLKATESLRYVKTALERYPDIDIIGTDEAAQAGDLASRLFPSGVSDEQLEASLKGPMEALLDSPLEDLAEHLLPVLPFVLIAVTEGRMTLLGRKPFGRALAHALERSGKTALAMAAGGLAYLVVDSLLVSLPVALLVRLSLNRYDALKRAVRLIETRQASLAPLRRRYAIVG